jgi:hypothetical protein
MYSGHVYDLKLQNKVLGGAGKAFRRLVLKIAGNLQRFAAKA